MIETTYSEDDIRDVAWKQCVNSIKAQSRALGIEPTIEAAIQWWIEQGGSKLKPPELAAQVTRYQRGVELNKQFVLVTSHRTQDNSEANEEFFKRQRNISGPVIFNPAGYVSTSQMWVFKGLRLRFPSEPEVEEAN